MNINKNNITYGKQLIGGERRDKGVLQLFCSDIETQYATGLNGTYNLILQDVKIIFSGIALTGVPFQIVSNTLRLDRGNDNTYVKVIVRSASEEKQTAIPLKQEMINNYIDVSFIRLGVIGSNLNTLVGGYNVLLTIEYERV